LLLHDKHPVSPADRQVLEAFVEQLIILPRRPLRSLKTLVAGLFAPYPLLASVNGLAGELQDTFNWLLGEQWDVVQIEHSYSFQPYEDALARKSQPFVLTEHNVESALGAATYDRLPRWSLPFIRYDQWRYARWERRVMRQAAQVVAVTQNDAHVLEKIAGKPVPVVVNGVDCDHFAAAHPDPSTCRVLFLGNYEYAPNVDAIEWALDEILPKVWARCADARMSVCGFGMPDSWRERWKDPRIEWQGFVPNLLDLQSSCSVSWRRCATAAAPSSRCSKPWPPACRWPAPNKACRGWTWWKAWTTSVGKTPTTWPMPWCACCNVLKPPPRWVRPAAPMCAAPMTGASPPANWSRCTPPSYR